MILDVPAQPNPSAVLVEAFESGIREPRTGKSFKNRGFLEAMKFLKSFRAHPLAGREKVTRIGLDHLGNVTVTLGDGPQIRLGPRPLERLEALEKIAPLLQEGEREQISYIDLQFDQVIVKRKK